MTFYQDICLSKWELMRFLKSSSKFRLILMNQNTTVGLQSVRYSQQQLMKFMQSTELQFKCIYNEFSRFSNTSCGVSRVWEEIARISISRNWKNTCIHFITCRKRNIITGRAKQKLYLGLINKPKPRLQSWSYGSDQCYHQGNKSCKVMILIVPTFKWSN